MENGMNVVRIGRGRRGTSEVFVYTLDSKDYYDTSRLLYIWYATAKAYAPRLRASLTYVLLYLFKSVEHT